VFARQFRRKSHRKFHIIAAAALTTVTCWPASSSLAAPPAAPIPAAGPCAAQSATLRAPITTARLCDGSGTAMLDPAQGGKMVDAAGGRLHEAVQRLAERLGMAGLAGSNSVMNVPDRAGMAAAAGVPALPGGVPVASGLKDVSTVAEEPDLPLPPPLGTNRLPVRMPEGTVARLPQGSQVAGAGTGSPAGPMRPVYEIRRETILAVLPEVPKALQGVHDATRLPGRNPATDGVDSVDGLLKGLGLD
jgi:hypothetical protein